jgi:DNA-binding cell septation regulator SpoVG
MENVEVLDITPSTNAGNIRAFVSIKIGEVTIHGCKVVHQDGQRPWVALPSREYAGKDGERRFSPQVELPDALRNEVARRVLDAWQKHEGRATYRDAWEE